MRFEIFESAELKIREYAKGFARKTGDDYEEEMLNLVLADFRADAIVLDKETTDYDDWTFKNELRDEEHKAKIRIWLDAVFAKTAGFVPLQFPFDPDSSDLSPASLFYTHAKVEHVFYKYSRDLEDQTEWAKDAMTTIMKNSADHLPECEWDSTNNVIKNIVDNLKKVESEVEQLNARNVVVKPGNIKQFWDGFKLLMEPFEKTWNEAAAKEFQLFERVSALFCSS